MLILYAVSRLPLQIGRLSPLQWHTLFPIRIQSDAMASDRDRGMASATDRKGPQVPQKAESTDLWSSLSTFINNGKQEYEGSSRVESMLGLSASLFEDVNSFVMEEEEPSKYVPPPTIDSREMQTNMQLEEVLYSFKDVLHGAMNTNVKAEKYHKAWRLVRDDVKVIDPLVCMNGKTRLLDWLSVLAEAGTVVDLHEIYAEAIRSPSSKSVYAIWTLSLDYNRARSMLYSSTGEWLIQDYEPLVTSKALYVVGQSLQLNLSGESKFDVDTNGKVLSIQSQWYILEDQGEEMFQAAKLLLTALLNKETSS